MPYTKLLDASANRKRIHHRISIQVGRGEDYYLAIDDLTERGQLMSKSMQSIKLTKLGYQVAVLKRENRSSLRTNNVGLE